MAGLVNISKVARRVLLVNASYPSYNLGLQKAANWFRRQGAQVELVSDLPLLLARPDVVFVSAIFSWHVPKLIHYAQQAIAFGIATEVGGPGTYGVQEVVERETGLKPQSSPDPRFEREPGQYLMVFWSRGCPAYNCSLGYPKDGSKPVCSVPAMEGWKYTLYNDVTPARVISDNNLSALPRHHQELIVDRTLAAGFPSVDANSGFEPRSFKPWVAELWKKLPLIAWRFAYDEIGEHDDVARVVTMLREAGVPNRKMHIYCLAGNESVDSCESRVNDINKWGGLPIVQRRRPIDWMEGPLPTLHDWTEQKLIDFQRWGNRLAKGMPFSDYRRSYRT